MTATVASVGQTNKAGLTKYFKIVNVFRLTDFAVDGDGIKEKLETKKVELKCP